MVIRATFVPYGLAEWPARVNHVRSAPAIGDSRFGPSKAGRGTATFRAWGFCLATVRAWNGSSGSGFSVRTVPDGKGLLSSCVSAQFKTV